MQNNFDISKLEANIRSAVLRLPVIAGNEVVNFALDNFKQQGFLGTYLQPWSQRKDQKKRNQGKAILIQTGRLRSSIRILRITPNSVIIGSNVPYAAAHNEGFRGIVNVRSHSRNQYSKKRVESGTLTKSGKMRMKTVTSIKSTGQVKEHTMNMNLPKRQFLGNSPYLTQRITRIIAAEILKASKQ